tara:strand:+ start:73968 stop:75350 length:1383 start_codon:yes stop_codon:yes gene_type:complete
VLQKNSGKIVEILSQNLSPTNGDKKEIKFNEAIIKKLYTRKAREIFWFQGFKGFGIRVSNTGHKTFTYVYSALGRTRWMTIGRYPEVSLTKALKQYAEAVEKRDYGEDPAYDRKTDNIDFRETPTVNQVIKNYIDYSIKTGKKSWKKEARYLQRDAAPYIGHHKIDKVKRKEIAQIVNKIIYERGSKHAACELLQYLKRLYNVSIGWGLCEHNPCYHIQKPAKTTRRDRVLYPEEIHRFWNNLEQANIVPIVKLALRFTLLTMARKSEVRFCEWSHINISNRTWLLPSTHSKNGRSHMIPLNDMALDILKEAYKYTGHSQFVFGSTRLPPNSNKKPTDLRALNKTAMSHALRKNIHLFNVVEKFTVHDLRRTGATLVTSLGCPRYWASLLLNHTDSSVTSIYDRYSYDWEKKCGMDVLGYSVKRISECPDQELVPSISQLRFEIEEKGILKFRYNRDSLE